MFSGKFEDVIPLGMHEQKEAIEQLKDYLEAGEAHQYTNFEIVLLKTLEFQQQEILKIPRLCGACQMGKNIELIKREAEYYPQYKDVIAIYEIQKNNCPKICPKYKG